MTQNNDQDQKTKEGNVQLWQFILELLSDPTNSDTVRWTSQNGDFQVLDPDNLAKLWGQKKGRTNMTYDKLCRALRYYYAKDILIKVPGQRYSYRFLWKPNYTMPSWVMPNYAAYRLPSAGLVLPHVPQNTLQISPQNPMQIPPQNPLQIPPQNPLQIPPQNPLQIPPQNPLQIPPQNPLQMPLHNPSQNSYNFSMNYSTERGVATGHQNVRPYHQEYDMRSTMNERAAYPPPAVGSSNVYRTPEQHSMDAINHAVNSLFRPHELRYPETRSDARQTWMNLDPNSATGISDSRNTFSSCQYNLR